MPRARSFPRFLRSPAVARMFGVTPETAARWIRAGRFGTYVAHAGADGRTRLCVREDAVQGWIDRQTARVLDPAAEGRALADEKDARMRRTGQAT